MAIDFQPLREMMALNNVSWYRLAQEGIDNKTIDRLRHDKNVTTKTISKLCDILDCDPEDILRRTSESNPPFPTL